MKIEHSDVSLFSSYQKSSKVEESEQLRIWGSQEDIAKQQIATDRFELSDKFKTAEKNSNKAELQESVFEVQLDSKLMSIIRALEALMGRKLNISLYSHKTPSSIEGATETKAVERPEEINEPQGEGWGIDYSYSRSEVRSEELKFSARGSISTKEGVNIDFKVAFSVSRSSATHESISFKAGDALIDPLVLNFGTDVISMSDIKHTFDLNLDGKENTFSFVGDGSGFLAFDKNGDGKINDGSELFGPTLGNGFDELVAYDEDNNMWIDENDSIFEKLLIWTKDENGKEELYTLKEKNVGALYLNSAIGSFDLEDAQNNKVAKIRESSIFLKENYQAGILQEVDLKV
ncbi:MAG: hypothetical protein WCY51_07605 [Sulfurimonas sp.]